MPKDSIIVINELPPKLTKDSGTPTTGNIPQFMPILTHTATKKITLMLAESKRLKVLLVLLLIYKILKVIISIDANKNMAPIKPNSSEKRANIKSVVCSGKKFKCAWVLCSHPLPNSPPDPIAIFD